MEKERPKTESESDVADQASSESQTERPDVLDITQLEDEMHRTEELTQERFASIDASVPEEIAKRVKERLRLSADMESIRRERADMVLLLREAIDYVERERAELSDDHLRERANFQGNWGELLRARLEHPIGYVKFAMRKLAHLESLRVGEPARFLDKKTDFQSYSVQQIREYDDVLQRVFSLTEVVSGGTTDAKKLGVGGYDKQPKVYTDAHKNDVTLTKRQRGIIEAHEAGHGVRQFLGSDGEEVRSLVDQNLLPSNLKGYLGNAEEIAERMAQLKNYFGMSATDDFSRQHLEYARKNYVKDVGLDNDMTAFMDAIPEDRTEKFIELMNELPL